MGIKDKVQFLDTIIITEGEYAGKVDYSGSPKEGKQRPLLVVGKDFSSGDLIVLALTKSATAENAVHLSIGSSAVLDLIYFEDGEYHNIRSSNTISEEEFMNKIKNPNFESNEDINPF